MPEESGFIQEKYVNSFFLSNVVPKKLKENEGVYKRPSKFAREEKKIRVSSSLIICDTQVIKKVKKKS